MLGPMLMIIAGIAIMPAVPVMGILLIVGGVVVTPFSRKMDEDVAQAEAAKEAANVPDSVEDYAGRAWTGALVFIGVLFIVGILAVQAGF